MSRHALSVPETWANYGPLFYPTNIVWHFRPRLLRACGRLVEWATLIWYRVDGHSQLIVPYKINCLRSGYVNLSCERKTRLRAAMETGRFPGTFCCSLSPYYYYYYYYYVAVVASCHRPFLLGTSPLEPMVIPTAQASSFTLQYFPYHVWRSKYSYLL